MNTLREAAQQALEALEIGYDSAQAEAHQFHAAMAGYKPQHHAAMDADVQKIAAAITALRAALAEPVRAEMTTQHNCTLDSPSDVYGVAVNICYENDDGTFWVSNDEYASQVNYCPVCGAKAPKQVEERS